MAETTESLSILASGIISGEHDENGVENKDARDRDFKLGGTPFVLSTFQLVSDATTSHLVSWSPSKDSFIIYNTFDFTNQILPKYFKHSNFNSFLRQLNAYGFRKTDNKQGWEFKHELFKEGQPHLLQEITRKKARRQLKEVSPSKENESKELSSPASVLQSLSSPSFSLSPVTRDLSRSLLDPELERIKDSNSHIINNLSQLQEQQKATHDTIARILEELVQSRKDQQDLQKIVEELFFNDPHDRKRKLEISHFESHKYAKGDEMSAIISNSSRRTRRHKDDEEGTDEEEGDAKSS